MEKVIQRIKKCMLALLLLALVAPYLQSRFFWVELAPLKGAITESANSDLTLQRWFSGEFQEGKEKYLNEKFGFRSLFIRINNQLSFSLFNTAKANQVIVGKENYLFEENYAKAFCGVDFIGFDSTARRMETLQFVQDTLSKLGKDFILVFAAGKGSFYSEYLPDVYTANGKSTNYETHVKLAKQLGIAHIDFQKYFLESKPKSKYPLFPQYGIHWSFYGSCLAADSIVRFIEHKRNIDMPNLYWSAVDWDQPRGVDYDIGDGMNILRRLESFDMAYPKIQFQSDSGKVKPSVLVIADSYYWEMFNFGLTRLFSSSQFWFYNKEIYPESYQNPLTTDQVDLKASIGKYDVVILLATEANLSKLGWGFIERMATEYSAGGKTIEE